MIADCATFIFEKAPIIELSAPTFNTRACIWFLKPVSYTWLNRYFTCGCCCYRFTCATRTGRAATNPRWCGCIGSTFHFMVKFCCRRQSREWALSRWTRSISLAKIVLKLFCSSAFVLLISVLLLLLCSCCFCLHKTRLRVVFCYFSRIWLMCNRDTYKVICLLYFHYIKSQEIVRQKIF